MTQNKEGQTGLMANWQAMKMTMGRMQRELAMERNRLNTLHGKVFDSKAAGMKELEEAMSGLGGGGADGQVQMVRPGDASCAAPFTSRAPSIKSVVDLIRQGRCTVLGTLQQMQIMVLESIISAYTLSALSLEGARSSERQMIASSWLLMTAGLAFSYASPVDKMHPQRPQKSLFAPSVLLSTIGQALIHLYCMVQAVGMATEVMGPAKLKEVAVFNRKAAAGELKNDEEADFMQLAMSMWSQPFMPNLMNTTVFLVETAQIIAVLFVNYKGRPWMKGLLENHALFLSVFITIGGVVFFAWGLSPEINKLVHLEAFPDDAYRFKVMGLVLASLFGTFIWDRLCTALFAPRIFKAMLSEAAKTTVADVLPIFKTLGYVAGGLAVFGTSPAVSPPLLD